MLKRMAPTPTLETIVKEEASEGTTEETKEVASSKRFKGNEDASEDVLTLSWAEDVDEHFRILEEEKMEKAKKGRKGRSFGPLGVIHKAVPLQDFQAPLPHEPNYERETDQDVISRRKKQIEYGKNTQEYHNYTAKVPLLERKSNHPKTPNIKRKYSRRAWDGLIKQWRMNLHIWSESPTSSISASPTSHLNDSFSSDTSTSTSVSTSTTSSIVDALEKLEKKNSTRNNAEAET